MDYLKFKHLASVRGLPSLSDAQVRNLAAFVQEVCDQAITAKIQDQADQEFDIDPASWSSLESAARIARSAFQDIASEPVSPIHGAI